VLSAEKIRIHPLGTQNSELRTCAMPRSLSYLPKDALQLDALALNALPEDTHISLETSRQYCRHLATSHYENFTVASWFLPKHLQPHFYNVYAYCRWSDDLADEIDDPAISVRLLDWWAGELQDCYEGHPQHPVFVALEETIHHFDIPITPFQDLLTAFRQDQIVSRYETYEALVDYCRYSANPVGHLVLYLCGYRDEERQQLSDATCTGLQLANFWQDISVDLDKGRIYLPQEDLDRFNYQESDLHARVVNDRFTDLMQFEVGRARALFGTGLQLCKMLDKRVRGDIELFNRGGMAILDQIEDQGYDVLSQRPSLSTGKKVALMLRYLLKRIF
jgi:squalene synthase HpnC